MNDMLALSVFYFVVAYLACWAVDLAVIVFRGPVLIDPILKLVFVLVCLIFLLVRIGRNGWVF